jgi:hypothetical protein
VTNEELAAHLAVVRSASGALTPEAVVDAAADPAHPLHGHFNWDNDEAADAWRRQQARMLIARVRVIVQKETARGVKELQVRGLASVVSPLTATREYVPVSEIRNDPVLAHQVLEAIRRDMNALRRKYSAYGDLFAQALAEIVEEAA